MSQPIQNYITEPQRQIPVIENPDLLVVGGGPAGITAALSAARCGVKTLLIERYNHLGGLWTGGLVLPLLSTHARNQNGEKQKVIFGIAEEITARMRALGMEQTEQDPTIDPEAAKYLFDQMLAEAGVQVLLHCWAVNVLTSSNRITAVIIESKSGRLAIQPKFVVDASGDDDVFALSGEDYVNYPYHIALFHRLGNMDTVAPALSESLGLRLGYPTPISGVRWVHMTGEKDCDGLDIRTLTRVTIESRRAIWEQVQALQRMPGCEQVFLLDTPAQTGVRVTRVLEGQYKVTLEDSFTFREFPDVIGMCGAWRDIPYQGAEVPREQRPLWQIPLRSLIPRKTGNLLVAGRCFSYEKGLTEDARIIGAALLTGHAAGAAAAVCLRHNTDVQQTDAPSVQKILLDQNAYLG